MAEGNLTRMFTCDFNTADTSSPNTYNGFEPTTSWVLGFGGEQVTEYAVTGAEPSLTSAWTHTNVFGPGGLLATYRDTNTYFELNDWLGSKRVEFSAGASPCAAAFGSLPFGSGLTPPGTLGSYPLCADATEHHFTGKERDTESGNDYFGARYYGSSMGRFLSPDWSAKEEPVPYAKLDDPQSLNLYAYVLNNPLSGVDADGHEAGLRYLPDGSVEGPYSDAQLREMGHDIGNFFGALYNTFLPIVNYALTPQHQLPEAKVDSTGAKVLALGASMFVGGGEEKGGLWLAEQIGSIGSRVGNIATKLLTPETLSAATREVEGGMSVAKAGGGLFSHVTKVEQGINGLNRQLAHAQKLLQRPGLSEEASTALQGQVNNIQGLLTKARAAITPRP